MNYSARFTHSTQQVYAALSSREHWDARIEEMRKYSENELKSFEVSDAGIDIVMHHVIPRTELPDIAQTVMKKDMVITRNVHFDAYGETTAGHYDASIPAGPGSLRSSRATSGPSRSTSPTPASPRPPAEPCICLSM